MRITYKRLFRIQLRHGWYPDGQMKGDVDVVPTPSTFALADELGLGIRMRADGLTVFGEIERDTDPPMLKRSLSGVSWRFAFELRSRNHSLLNITDLPAFRPGQTIFCFDNLRADVDGSGVMHLGDAIAGARIGPAVTLVSSDFYTHTLGAPSAGATVTIRDRFGATVATLDARSPDPSAPIAEYRVDFATIPAMLPGRYEIADDQGGVAAIYYDRGLAASRPFGVIEIFSRTDGLTPDATDHVPAPYRFIDGDTVTGLDPYEIEFEPIATTWRYLVTKKYPNNGIALSQLSIDGPIAFTVAVDGDTAIFTSQSAVALSAAPRGLKLATPARTVRDLPDPDLTTPLGAVAALPNFVSDMFVYV